MCVILNYITLCYSLTRTVLAEKKKISQSKCNAQGSNNCSPSGIRASGSIFSSQYRVLQYDLTAAYLRLLH